MSAVSFRYLAISNHKICPVPLSKRINRLFELGVPAVQLRDKEVADRKKFKWGRRIETKGNSLLVNSRADIARLIGAAGVHRAGSALSSGILRKIAGEEIIVGVSTHTADEVKNALSFGADYLTFGPIWPTPSKPNLSAGDCPGLAGLEKICEISPVPVFALGGVEIDRIGPCLQAGAYGVAGIRSLFSPDNPQNNWQKIQKEIKLHSS